MSSETFDSDSTVSVCDPATLFEGLDKNKACKHRLSSSNEIISLHIKTFTLLFSVIFAGAQDEYVDPAESSAPRAFVGQPIGVAQLAATAIRS